MGGGGTWSTAGVRVPVRKPVRLRLFALAAFVAACASSTEPAPYTLTAILSGIREVPPNLGKAEGLATVTIAGNRMTYEVTATGLTAPLILGNIHVGTTTNVGPIIVPFKILAQSGRVASGEVDLTKVLTYNTLTLTGDSLRTLINNGYTYVNLFTTGYPGGEIRGQILAP